MIRNFPYNLIVMKHYKLSPLWLVHFLTMFRIMMMISMYDKTLFTFISVKRHEIRPWWMKLLICWFKLNILLHSKKSRLSSSAAASIPCKQEFNLFLHTLTEDFIHMLIYYSNNKGSWEFVLRHATFHIWLILPPTVRGITLSKKWTSLSHQ